MRNAVGVGVREVESRLEVSLGEEGTPPALKLAPLRRRVLFQMLFGRLWSKLCKHSWRFLKEHTNVFLFNSTT